MPYLRIYSPDIPIEQKRVIAQKLIEITQRAFHLLPEERHRITVQFILPPRASDIDSFKPAGPRDDDVVLEVIAHHLTEAKKGAFRAEAATRLVPLLPAKARSRIARLLGIKLDPPQVVLQFDDLSPAISDPLVADPERHAA